MSLPTIANPERILVRILREVAAESEIKLTTFSKDWCIRMEKDSTVRYVYGYKFDVNPASSQHIADDKCAASDVMMMQGIAHIEHRLFLQPDMTGYINGHGNWAALLAYAQQHHFNLVCKANEGTSGHDVYRTRDHGSLERVVHKLFQAYRGIAVSPYFEIEQEYRIVLLQNECELIYAKQRPTIVGNGHTIVAELIVQQIEAHQLSAGVAADAFERHKGRLKEVLVPGELLLLTWKHNLSLGAQPIRVEDEALRRRLVEQARSCAEALNLTLAVVDIVSTQGDLLVLEVNSGLMLENFARRAPDGYARAKVMYKKLVELMFQER